jgi:hypothetical protein
VTQPASSAPAATPSFAFRRRGTQTSRLEAFSDAVFALTLTLLVVSTEVPKTFGDLMTKLSGFLPFGLCFVIFLTIWLQHFVFFRRYGLTDLGTILINSALLLVVLFFVYPLKFLFTATGTDLPLIRCARCSSCMGRALRPFLPSLHSSTSMPSGNGPPSI